MKMLLEYLDRAVALEQLSATEPNDVFKAELLKQASAYRELARLSAPRNTGCGHRGADVRPDFGWKEAARRTTIFRTAHVGP